MSDPSPSPARPPIPHTKFGIRKLEMLMPWHRMMERLGVGQRPQPFARGWSGIEWNPLPTFSRLTPEHGAVWWVL